jgi:predicted DNA-binding transcriptional regulator AlpA
LTLKQTVERELLDEKEAAHYLGISVATLRRHRYRIGDRTDGTSIIKIGRAVRYARSDLDKFIKAQKAGSFLKGRDANER